MTRTNQIHNMRYEMIQEADSMSYALMPEHARETLRDYISIKYDLDRDIVTQALQFSFDFDYMDKNVILAEKERVERYTGVRAGINVRYYLTCNYAQRFLYTSLEKEYIKKEEYRVLVFKNYKEEKVIVKIQNVDYMAVKTLSGSFKQLVSILFEIRRYMYYRIKYECAYKSYDDSYSLGFVQDPDRKWVSMTKEAEEKIERLNRSFKYNHFYKG